MKLTVQKLQGWGENFIILSLTVFDWSTRVTDGRTDRQIGLSSVLSPCQHSIGYMGDGFYPRDAMLARVIAITTCLSVRHCRYCVKTKKA